MAKNLSNIIAPIIAINADTVLFKRKEEVGAERKTILGRIMADLETSSSLCINDTNAYLVNYIRLYLDYNVYILTDRDVDEVKEVLDSYPIYYNAVREMMSEKELNRRLQLEFVYYVDDDPSRICRINHVGAINVTELSAQLTLTSNGRGAKKWKRSSYQTRVY